MGSLVQNGRAPPRRRPSDGGLVRDLRPPRQREPRLPCEKAPRDPCFFRLRPRQDTLCRDRRSAPPDKARRKGTGEEQRKGDHRDCDTVSSMPPTPRIRLRTRLCLSKTPFKVLQTTRARRRSRERSALCGIHQKLSTRQTKRLLTEGCPSRRLLSETTPWSLLSRRTRTTIPPSRILSRPRKFILISHYY